MNDIDGGGGSGEGGCGSESARDRDDEVVARRFDWALREVVGGEAAPDVTAAVLARAAAGEEVAIDDAAAEAPAMSRLRWLAVAAVFLLGVLTVLGVALLQRRADGGEGGSQAAQGPEPAKLLEVTRLEAIAALPRDLKSVELRNVEDAAVAELVARCPQVEHLRVWASTMARRKDDVAESITDAALASIAKLTKLRHLELVGVVKVTGSGLVSLDALPLLESLALRFFDVGDDALQVLPRLPSLRALDLSNNQVIGARGLEAVGKCVGLRRLNLHAIPGQESGAFAPLGKLALLESLELSGINQFHRGVADEATQKRFNLPTLAPPRLPDGGVKSETLQHWPRLHTLSLAYSPSLEADVGVALLPRCPRLRDLDLGGCPNVDDTTIEQLAGIPTLRRLALANCTGLGERSIQALAAAPGLQVVDFGTWSWLDDNSPFLSLAEAESLLRSGKRVDWHPPPDRRQEFAELRRRYAGAYGEARTEVVRTLAELEALPESVTRIECRGLGDRAATVLATRTALVALEFVNDSPTDRLTRAGLAAVCQLPRLESLVLMNLPELHGSDFKRLRDLDAVRSLTFVGCDVGDEALAELPKLERLAELNVSAIRSLTLAGVESIARCRELRTLRLAKCTQLDAEAIAQVGALRKLTLLDLSENPGLRDRALMGLRECRAMRRLDLADGRFTSNGLQALPDMQQLAWLDLSGNDEVVSSALQHVPESVQTLRLARCSGLDATAATLLRDRFPKLAELDVGQNDWVTDDVLRILVEAPSLQVLDLLRCQKLTNASFATLRDARSLRRVVVTGTACMSATQHADLAKLRPELEVVRQVW